MKGRALSFLRASQALMHSNMRHGEQAGGNGGPHAVAGLQSRWGHRDSFQEWARALQWMRTCSLGRTGWDSTEAKLLLFSFCKRAAEMHGALAWDGWGVRSELSQDLQADPRGQCFDGCLLQTT